MFIYSISFFSLVGGTFASMCIDECVRVSRVHWSHIIFHGIYQHFLLFFSPHSLRYHCTMYSLRCIIIYCCNLSTVQLRSRNQRKIACEQMIYMWSVWWGMVRLERLDCCLDKPRVMFDWMEDFSFVVYCPLFFCSHLRGHNEISSVSHTCDHPCASMKNAKALNEVETHQSIGTLKLCKENGLLL